MKKIIATICVLILTAGLLCACGKQKENQNQAPVNEDPSAPSSVGPTSAPHITQPPSPPPK